MSEPITRHEVIEERGNNHALLCFVLLFVLCLAALGVVAIGLHRGSIQITLPLTPRAAPASGETKVSPRSFMYAGQGNNAARFIAGRPARGGVRAPGTSSAP